MRTSRVVWLAVHARVQRGAPTGGPPAAFSPPDPSRTSEIAGARCEATRPVTTLTEQPIMCLRLGTSCRNAGTTWSNSAPSPLLTKTMASSGSESCPMDDMMLATASLAASSITGSRETKLPHRISADDVLTTLPVASCCADARGITRAPRAAACRGRDADSVCLGSATAASPKGVCHAQAEEHAVERASQPSGALRRVAAAGFRDPGCVLDPWTWLAAPGRPAQAVKAARLPEPLQRIVPHVRKRLHDAQRRGGSRRIHVSNAYSNINLRMWAVHTRVYTKCVDVRPKCEA
eukprot:351282-Chlamydomonas_euryale.AAC.3